MQAGVVPSVLGGIRQIWKTEGLPGFFTGYRATLLRDVPYTMLELGLYDNFKTLIKKYRKRETLTTMVRACVPGVGVVRACLNGWFAHPPP